MHISEKYPNDTKYQKLHNEAQDSGLTKGVTSAFSENKCGVGYFTFTGVDDRNSTRSKDIIEFITPFLSLTINRIINPLIARKKYVLTPREIEVLKWLVDGRTYQNIGNVLSISTKTVGNHIDSIRNKLNARTSTEIVAIAVKENIIEST